MMSIYNIDELPIESKMLTVSIDDAQKKIENYFFDIRKNLFDYDQISERVIRVVLFSFQFYLIY